MKCDVDTFARMYEEIYNDLYRFALCMMKNEQDAEDAVSDAVLSGYENIRIREYPLMCNVHFYICLRKS